MKLPGVEAIRLDVTNPDDIAAAAERYTDVQVADQQRRRDDARCALIDHGLDARALRDLFEVNVIGPMALTQAFAPILKRNGGGAVVNILSVLSWVALPTGGAYSVSNRRPGLTNVQRQELRGGGHARGRRPSRLHRYRHDRRRSMPRRPRPNTSCVRCWKRWKRARKKCSSMKPGAR